jgi:hypothetical protein
MFGRNTVSAMLLICFEKLFQKISQTPYFDYSLFSTKADAAVFSINVAATAHAALQGFAFTAGRQETLTAMIEAQVRARVCVFIVIGGMRWMGYLADPSEK